MDARSHIPVLLREAIDLLAPRPGDTALDCTAGLGGHAAALAERIGPGGVIVINDADPANVAAAADRVRSLPRAPRVVEFRGNFAGAPRKLAEQGLSAAVVLADLGFSSSQVSDPLRGLSFSVEGPLDMRLDPGGATTAADLVNSLPERDLGEIIRDYGEERHFRRVARKLVEARTAAPIHTTVRLAQIVRSAVGGRGGMSRIDPATRTFQALRIAVNDELGSLDALLESVRRAAAARAHGGGQSGWLAPGARIAVISFHSLEDRPVKRAFADLVDRGLATALTKRPVTPSDEETDRNPRSRSARLRAIRLA